MEPITPTNTVPRVADSAGGGRAEASALVAACEHAWRAIQVHHRDVPDVVIILGTGVERGRLVKLGHWTTARWTADGHTRGEVLLAGEALHRSAADVFEVLLHEATHGLNTARKIKDASRGGRYHNRRFKTTAEELGLTVATMAPFGYADTTLTPAAKARYALEIAGLGDAMRIARNHTNPGPTRDDQTGPGPTGNGGSATCGCGRRMRMAPTVLARGPVICGICDHAFTIGRNAAEPAASDRPDDPRVSETVVDGRFDRMCEQALNELVRLDQGPGTAERLTRVAAWYGQRHTDQPAPLTGTSDELDALARSARAMLVLDGTIHEPEVEIHGRHIGVGEHVVLARHHDTADLDDRTLPPAGVFGIVEAIDKERRELHVDFAISGTHRIALDGPIARSLQHAYVELESLTARPIAARTVTRAEVEVGIEIEP